MKRIGAALGGALLLLLGYIFIPSSQPRIAAPSAGDCTLIELWSNGYHSDIALPVAMLPADHPLRRIYPNAREITIGWGDDAFYQSDGSNIWLGVRAIFPDPSVMHVVNGWRNGANYLGPTSRTPIAISGEGAAALSAYLADALELDANGAAIVVAPGKVSDGQSFFLRSGDWFHIFNVCNQWMANALRSAGLNVNARAAWMADGLTRQAEARALHACPEAPLDVL
jgi:uncharacterized protein (TIGR02117 family)